MAHVSFPTHTDKRRYLRRRGSNSGFSDDSDSRNLLKQNRGLAKSTTALNTSLVDSPKLSRYELRGKKNRNDVNSSVTNYSVFLLFHNITVWSMISL